MDPDLSPPAVELPRSPEINFDEEFGVQNLQLPYSVLEAYLETEETRIIGSDIEGQMPTIHDYELGQCPLFPWFLPSGPAEEITWPMIGNGFTREAEDIHITEFPNLPPPSSVEGGFGESNSIPWLPHSQLPSFFEEFDCQISTPVVQSLLFSDGDIGNIRDIYQPLPSFDDYYNQIDPVPVETPYTSLNGTYHGRPPHKRVKLSSKGSDTRPYNEFSPEEMEKLVEGVEKYGGARYHRWKTIKDKYFKNDSHRTPNNLKEKWRHMWKTATFKRDSDLTKLYMRALKVEENFKSSKCK